MIDVSSLLSKLSARRPIFHSEADFQHALAWQIQLEHADADLRLEHPLVDGQRGAIDILVRLDNQVFALELKYLSRNLIHETGHDRFALKSQSAHDIRRYDVCKDIQRVEQSRLTPAEPVAQSSLAMIHITGMAPNAWIRAIRCSTSVKGASYLAN